MKDAQLRCSFCGKGQKEVKKLIAGPGVRTERCQEGRSAQVRVL